MPRGSRTPSEVFASVIEIAKERLVLGCKSEKDFEHRGIKGDERAALVADFLRAHLPARFNVAKGEAIDYKDNRTGQLDIIIYDAHTSSPIVTGKENQLIPAEALYAVIEVKTTLSNEELKNCYLAAQKIRQLRPFKRFFIPPRTAGYPAADSNPRCIYSVFSYFTNLVEKDWLQKEFDRVKEAAKSTKSDIHAIDRILVLTRGFILPQSSSGKEEDADSQSIFLDFYLHLINFLSREIRRREPIDWQLYGARTSPGWMKLK